VLLLNLVFGLPMTIGIISLLVWQMTMVIEATTTIEDMEKKKARKTAALTHKSFTWAYDFGWKQNFLHFFGRSFSYAIENSLIVL
jgi:hypothetical protein